MRETQITFPELALVAGTRGALGAGIGLLLSSRLTREQCQAAGWALVAFGALTTIPLAFEIFGRRAPGEMTSRQSRAERPQLVTAGGISD
jgi:hypothetical protein